MGISDIFKPKSNKFLLLLAEQATLMEKGLELLKSYLEKHDPKIAKELTKTEKEADEVRRVLMEELMKTFVTPFDREDVAALSLSIDDVLDYAETTVDEMEILEVSSTPYMLRMVSLLHDAGMEVRLGVESLQDKHYKVATDHVQRAKSIENRVEAVYREALADLFRGPKNVKHVMVMLKVREIYRHLSNSADRLDTSANVIADIIMKIG